MTPDIRFDPDFPDQYVASMTRHLRRWAPDLVPQFNVLQVTWQDPDGRIAAIAVQDEYRTANLFVHPVWAQLSEEERDELVVHELSHMNQAPLGSAISSVVRHHVPEDRREYVIEELNRAAEGANEDMARAYLRLYTRLKGRKRAARK